MNCPNCDKEPSSLIHNIKMGGVGFKKALEGFVRCQNCEKVLKHKRHFNAFIAFEKRYYPYFFLLFSVFVAAFFSAFNLIETHFAASGNSAAFIHLIVLGIITLSFIAALSTLSLKFAIYEISNESELTNQQEIETKYQLLFLTYFLGALLSGILIFYIIEAYSPGFEVFLSIVFAYIILVIGLGIWIVGKSAPESEKEAAMVYSKDDSSDKPV